MSQRHSKRKHLTQNSAVQQLLEVQLQDSRAANLASQRRSRERKKDLEAENQRLRNQLEELTRDPEHGEHEKTADGVQLGQPPAEDDASNAPTCASKSASDSSSTISFLEVELQLLLLHRPAGAPDVRKVQDLHNLHLQSVMRMATLFQYVMSEEASKDYRFQGITPPTSEPGDITNPSSSLQASPRQWLQHEKRPSNVQRASPGPQPDGGSKEGKTMHPGQVQQPTPGGDTSLPDPTDMLLLDEVFSKGRESVDDQQFQQQTEQLMGDQQQGEQHQDEGVDAEKQLQQEVTIWRWISNYCHLSGSGPIAELVRATAVAGHPDAASWDVLVADVTLSETQCSYLHYGLSSYVSTLRDLNQHRRAAAAALSSLAVDSMSSSQREALCKQGQARELLGQMTKYLEEEQLAMARLHRTLFTQVLSCQDVARLLVRCYPQYPDTLAICMALLQLVQQQLLAQLLSNDSTRTSTAPAAAQLPLQPAQGFTPDAAATLQLPSNSSASTALLVPPLQLPGAAGPSTAVAACAAPPGNLTWPLQRQQQLNSSSSSAGSVLPSLLPAIPSSRLGQVLDATAFAGGASGLSLPVLLESLTEGGEVHLPATDVTTTVFTTSGPNASAAGKSFNWDSVFGGLAVSMPLLAEAHDLIHTAAAPSDGGGGVAAALVGAAGGVEATMSVPMLVEAPYTSSLASSIPILAGAGAPPVPSALPEVPAVTDATAQFLESGNWE